MGNNILKKEYNKPEIELVIFESEDILEASNVQRTYGEDADETIDWPFKK